MFIKFSPCKSNIDTILRVKDENTIIINGEEYEFDTTSVIWPDIRSQTSGAILEAKREPDGLMYITMIRKYLSSCVEWDTGTYWSIEPTLEVIEPTPDIPPEENTDPIIEEPIVEIPPAIPPEEPILPPEEGII